MALPYDFTAQTLGNLGLEPQVSNMGMLEIHLDRLPFLQGGKSALILGLSEFNLPEGRRVNTDQVQYLFGVVNYPTKVNPIDKLTCSFVDYINGRQRDILHRWFDLIYNERTGLGTPLYRTDAHAVFFDRQGIERIIYHLHGIFPTKDPAPPDVNYGDARIVKISMEFSMDWYEEILFPRSIPTASPSLFVGQFA